MIAKKAPGDRSLSGPEVARIAALVAAKEKDGKVSPLPKAILKECLRILRQSPVPETLSSLLPDEAARIPERIATALEKEVEVSVVDLEGLTGFPRENARPVLEVLLFRRGMSIVAPGPRVTASSPEGKPAVFLTAAFVRKASDRPRLLLQAVLHPLVEWTFGLPHMVAVLCESAYNAGGEAGVSDLNRFIAEEAGRDRDFGYFDRILSAPYEPDEFRMEELAARFGPDEAKIADVVARARAAGEGFRSAMEEVLARTRDGMHGEEIRRAREVLEGGDADGALVLLRQILASLDLSASLGEEARALLAIAVRAYALDADPAYEGLRLENGEIVAEPWAGRKARALREVLVEAVGVVRVHRRPPEKGHGKEEGSAPLGEGGPPRTLHVVADLERPSAKFVDGHDRLHWVFERAFVEGLIAGRAAGVSPAGIPALLACRFVRDGVFPDEKLKIERQFAVAVKGAVEGYRFYQALPAPVREEMAAFYDASGLIDPLYLLFVSLGGETQAARASHMIRRSVGKTHSYNYVRYPETPLAGQVVVITGGGTGMGRSLALEAAIRGANVVITGRRPAPLEGTKADMDDLIRHLGLTNQTLAIQGDVGDPKYVGEMFDRIEREFGRIDVLYNNAGVSGPVEFGSVYREEQFDEFREAVNIHLTGAWLASLEAARIMESRPRGGTIVMVGTFYSESIHRNVLHAYPGRLPYTVAQSAKLALADALAWTLAPRNISVCSLNPSAVATERIARGAGVFDKGSRARARVGRHVPPEALERDTVERTVTREFVRPRDFSRVALDLTGMPFRRTLGGQRLPMGGVTYEQPPGILPSPAALERYPDMVGKVALVTVHRPTVGDAPLVEACVAALARSGASVVLAGDRVEELERVAVRVNASGGEGMATVHPADLGSMADLQALFGGLPRLDLLLHVTGSVDWKRPLTSLPHEEWDALVARFGLVPRALCWQAERRMDRDRTDGTIVLVGPDLSGVPSIRERNVVQVFQAMLRPAVATEAMERALMRKAQAEGTAPAPVGDVNIGLILPGRSDGRNRAAAPDRTAATVLWLLEAGKKVSGTVLLPDEQNAIARLPGEVREAPGTLAGKVAVVTGGIRNLGREISLKIAAERATVVVASRRPRPDALSGDAADKARADLAAADAVLARMRASGGRCLWVDADVSRPARVRALVDETRHRFGRIDVLVNNAGAGGEFSLAGAVLREHRASWDATLRANFLGPWAATAFLRDLMAGQPGGGTIVNVSTHYADHPYLFRTIYTVSKILLKALTLALRDPLAERNVRICDVAPTLIAGPRMDWVMRNYATTFAGQFGLLPDLRPAEKGVLQDLFIRSFDRALAPEERKAAEASFLASLRDTRLSRARQAELAGWYARMREWFRATVPVNPPANEEVAEAVLFGAKNARFLEDRFIGVADLPPFESFPAPWPPRRTTLAGAPVALLAAGRPGEGAAVDGIPVPAAVLAGSLADTGAKVTALAESAGTPGQVTILRPPSDAARGGKRKPAETLTREIDLGEPRLLEPWLDNSLLGGAPPEGAVVLLGPAGPERGILDRAPDEMEGFLAHLGKGLNAFAEAARAVRDGGHVIVAVPRADEGEGTLLRAAMRQVVRTSLAEQHFLPAAKKVRASLVELPPKGRDKEFAERVVGILAGESPPSVEEVPVGRPRP